MGAVGLRILESIQRRLGRGSDAVAEAAAEHREKIQVLEDQLSVRARPSWGQTGLANGETDSSRSG